ncbi:sensor histidine kinase [Archangium primigenium]|uniref:sensor histidine kinase n=1 Tax=[Archangium] primigenium TaxID=2792470 RepID=UPI0019597E51|nr:GAF domain-containing sensor histidine kinase [Archangium primigenium]MBM7118874.1 GAF domain-containing sensor histidine kinase [Archangium primigenium]
MDEQHLTPTDSPGAFPGTPTQAPTRRHLEPLYDISKRLTCFESVARTFPEVMALAAQVVPLRTVLLLEGVDEGGQPSEARPHVTVWRRGRMSAQQLRLALQQATETYAYLLGQKVVEVRGEAVADVRGRRAPTPAPTPPPLITLPLAIKGRVFGTLQLEMTGGVAEEELAFIAAVAHQLAGALDRHHALRREVHLRERAETLERAHREFLAREREARLESEAAHRRQTLLAEAGAVLSTSLDPQASLGALARLLVPAWADCCAIELFEEDPRNAQRVLPRRIATVAAAPQDAMPGQDAFVTHVLRSHPWVASTGGLDHPPRGHALVERMDAPGFPSNLRLLIRVRECTLGAVSLVSARPGRYGPAELALFEALAQRIAMAVDLARLYQQAEEASRWREEMLATVSHDIKTSLLAVRLNTEMAQAGARPEDNPRQQKYLERILQAEESMRGLIENILDRARMQGVPVPLTPQPQRVEELLHETCDSLRPLAQHKEQRLRVEPSSGLPLVSVDRERIHQVLANLVGNALKYTPSGGRITLRATPEPGQVRITVEDTGPGISPEDLPHVFGRFWRAHRATAQGTGLGLSIAKGIVEAHGGTIGVESRYGEGSTFFFTLPRAPA